MKQIANRAGVSISTVSLVLNNRDIGRVSPDVAERVRDIAAELGYLTNRLASGLRTSSTRTIGFLSDEVATTPFAGRMIEGAQDAARMPAFFDKHPDVDGFFCFNDTRAWAIYTEATRRGLIYRQRLSRWLASTTTRLWPKRWIRRFPLWNCRITRWATGQSVSWSRSSKARHPILSSCRIPGREGSAAATERAVTPA